MGLDMYLEARKYFSKVDFRRESNETLADYKEIVKLFPAGADELGESTGATINLTIGYWRKANQIHAWFVNECGGGVDECQPIRVSEDKLRELRAITEHTLETKDTQQAEKHLPTQAGFFFGGTEYDEYYWHDLERTKQILDKAIDLTENHNCDIIYQASW